MDKKRVFLSFDFDHDKRLRGFIVEQSHLSDSPFEIIDTSSQETVPMKAWEDKTRSLIRQSDMVVVMVGPQTHKASGVLKEVRIAIQEAKPIVQMVGYKDGEFDPVPNAGDLYYWSWEGLKELIG